MPRRPAQVPPDTWPPRMMAPMSAGFCGELHVEDFLEGVKAGRYPQPRVVESTRRKFWYRSDLEKALGLTEAQTNMGKRFGAKVGEKRHG